MLDEPNTTSGQRNSRATETREALISAATTVFARDGFAAASTRDIAQAADVNLALIAYHFGGKDGLYLAVFDTIAERLAQSRRQMPARTELLAALHSRDPEDGRRQAIELIEELLVAHLQLLLQPGMADVARLVVREQLDPGPAFERLWNGVLADFLTLLTSLLRFLADLDGALPPRQRTPQARVQALNLIGLCVVFRVARATVVRHLGWQQDQVPSATWQRRIEQQLRANIRTMLCSSASGICP